MGHKTFTSLSYVNLYSKDKTIHDSKVNIMLQSDNMSAYNKQFFFFEHTYRTRFKEEYLEKYGASYKAANTNVIIKDDESIKNEILNKVDDKVVSIVKVELKKKALSIAVKDILQKKYKYEFYCNDFTVITKYTGSNKDDLCCSGENGIVLCKCCTDNDDCDNDDCDGEDPSCKAVYNHIFYEYTNDSNSEIKFTLSNSSNDDIENIEFIEPVSIYENNVLIYYTIDTDYAIDNGYTVDYPEKTNLDYRVFVSDADEDDSAFYSMRDDIEPVSPIICLKRKNELKTDENNTKKLLKKYGLSQKDLIDTLKNDDLDNMYLFTGAYFRDIYYIKPGTYTAEEAQNFPRRVLIKSRVDENKYVVTEEISTWWKNKNRLKMSRYNIFLYDLLKYYCTDSNNYSSSKIVKIEEDDIVTNIEIEIKDPVYDDGEFNGDNGVILPSTKIKDGKYSRTSAIFVENRLFTVERNKQWFIDRRDNAPNWLFFKGSSLFNDDSYYSDYGDADTYTYRYSNSSVNALSDDETLPVDVTGSSIFIQKYKEDNTPYYIEISIYLIEQLININSQHFTIGLNGKWMSSSSGENSGDDIFPLVPIPLELLNNLRFSTYVIVKEYGTMFVAYAEVVVKTHWYDKFLSLIISIVIGILTYGIGNIISIIVNAIINYVISLVVQNVLKAIDSKLFNLIFELVSMVYNDFSSIINLTAENFLKLATDITSFTNDVMQYIHNQEAKDLVDNSSKQKAIDKINSIIDTDKNIVLKLDQTAMSSFSATHSPDALYESVLSGSYNYDQLFSVDTEVNKRINIVSG